MLHFKTILQRFDKQGEKTGWTYILITEEQANELNPGKKVSFRVKGKLDNFKIEKIALMPMGDGSFIMPLKATIRKAIKKEKGAEVEVRISLDAEPLQID